MQTDVESVARGLTEAQREALANADVKEPGAVQQWLGDYRTVEIAGWRLSSWEAQGLLN